MDGWVWEDRCGRLFDGLGGKHGQGGKPLDGGSELVGERDVEDRMWAVSHILRRNDY